MKKRAKICFYIFVACAFFALGILGYFVLNPKNDNVMIGSRKFVVRTQVPNAYSYALSVKAPNSSEISNQITYTINKELINSNNEYKFIVDVSKNDVKLAQETYIQKVTNIYDNLIDCEINNYTIVFFDENGEELKSSVYEDQYLTEVDKNMFWCVISEYFGNLFCLDGNYNIVFVALDKDGNEIEEANDEFIYDYHAYYKDDFIRRNNFFINGAWYDYIIDSREELKNLVWHTILYRENDVTFYVNTNEINQNNINKLVIDAINDYPEYDGLEEKNTYASMIKKLGKLENFSYYLDKDFTRNFYSLQQRDGYAYDYAIDFLHKKDVNFNAEYIAKAESSERNFAIDSLNNEVEVENTEQLFMVVQYGAKPKFSNESSVAKTVYENAKNELKKINNSDTLSDYEKALNIYRYICNNVTYDYVTYRFMEYKNDFLISSFGNYNCFYLEGVFLDLNNQYAVCDGLAKAYALLCNIEGISCVKVNGEITNLGNHAWNKVCLENSQEETDWYYVDTTWGVATYSKEVEEGNETKKEYFEFLTHAYFLTSNESNKIIHFESGVTDQAIDFEYYKNNSYAFIDKFDVAYIGDFYITNNDELSEIFKYVLYQLEENDNYVLEIKVDKNYIKKANSEIRKFLLMNYSTNKTVDYNAWFSKLGISEDINCEWLLPLDDVLIFRFCK